MARSADDRALGHSRSGGGQGQSRRNRDRLQRRVPHARAAHRDFCFAADQESNPTQPARALAGHRPHGGRRHEGCRADLTAGFSRRLASEGLGTAFLLAAGVRSGIMAQRLAGANGALALLCNPLPTGAILTVLILTFGPVSGAHFNPAVSIALALRRELPPRIAGLYIGAQIIGGIVGVLAAHAMFELPLWQVSMNARTGPGQWFAETVATFGLLL